MTRSARPLRAAEPAPGDDEILRRSQWLQRSLLENLPDTTVFLLDRDYRVIVAQGDAMRALPWADETLFKGRRVEELAGEVPAEVFELAVGHYAAGFAGEASEFAFTSSGLTFELRVVPVRGDEGEVESVLVIARDVTEARATERQLARRAAQQEAVAQLGQMALAGGDLHALMQAAVVAVSVQMDMQHSGLMALDEAEGVLKMVAGAGWQREHFAAMRIPLHESAQATYTLRAEGPVVVDDYAAETRFSASRPSRDMGFRSGISVAVRGRVGSFGVLGALSREPHAVTSDDVNFLTAVAHLLATAFDRDHDERATRHAALHDPLTGLPNRTLLRDRLEHALARRRRESIDVAVLMVDLDGFKVINDSLGHDAGDELLLAVAPRLQAAMRPSDSVGRVGGDEFVAVCELASGQDAVRVAQRVADALAQPVALRSGEHLISASVGIAVADHRDVTPESLLRDADAAMYRAKARGRGRYEIFDEAMRERVMRRLATEHELRAALERDEIEVHYQPIVELRDGRPVGLEALARWRHPQRGLLAPDQFIAVAEETGLIVDLGRRVLEIGAGRAADWERRFGTSLGISVNVSARQLADPQFPGDVAEIAAASGLAAGALALEITESVLLEDAESPLAVLTALHERGLRLELDDFGTGYSSLSYLKRFPLDGLKIDRSFLVDLETDPRAAAIVQAVIHMAGALAVNVVTEGVESESQLARLRELGCHRAQGYHFSRPLPADAMTAWLEARL